MLKNDTLWKLVDDFIEVVFQETGYPVVIYDTDGCIVRATDKSRIGTVHAGAEQIMHASLQEYAVTGEEAERNPFVREGFSVPIRVAGETVAGFGITGRLDVVTPLARVASRTIEAWIKEHESHEQLVRSEQKYRNFFEHSPNGIFRTDLKGKLIVANPVLAELLKYESPGEMLRAVSNVSTQLYLSADAREELLGLLRQRERVRNFITMFKCKDGTVKCVRINAYMISGFRDNTIYIEGVIEDITERHKAETALRLSEEKFWKAFNNSPVWVVLSSRASGRYIDVNESFLTAMGYQRGEVIGRTSVEIGSLGDSEDRKGILEEIDRNGRVREREIQRRTAGGNVLETLLWTEAITVAGEKCLLSVSMDITGRKRAEQEKAQLERVLAHSQKMDAIGQLAGGIAHDFNNMLGGIVGAAEMLSMYLPDDPKARKFHQLIMESAGRSADLVKKLLAFSRNNPQLSSTIDVHDVLRETIMLLENTIDRRVVITVNLEAKESTIIGDPTQLQNSFLNMGINSSHAMPSGGTLCFSTRNLQLDAAYCRNSTFEIEPGEFLEIEIRDDGHGIELEHMGMIFDPFFTTKDQDKGTGLGLSAVYGSMQQHKGAVTVYSEVGCGTTFHLFLPVVSGRTELIQRVKPEAIKGSGTILVVDDEEVMRITAKAILEELGYRVLLAEHGQEALDVYKEQAETIALVILDMVMPVMGGKESFAALKNLDSGVKVLLSSGFTREEDLEQMRLEGLDGFIRKPYSSARLSQIIHETLG